jgi:hypothetical protein
MLEQEEEGKGVEVVEGEGDECVCSEYQQTILVGES